MFSTVRHGGCRVPKPHSVASRYVAMNGTSTAWRNGQLGCLGVLLISRLVGYYAKAAWATGIADTYRRYRVGRVFSKGKAHVFLLRQRLKRLLQKQFSIIAKRIQLKKNFLSSQRIAEPGAEGIDDGFLQGLGFANPFVQTELLHKVPQPPRKLHRAHPQLRITPPFPHTPLQPLPKLVLIISSFFHTNNFPNFGSGSPFFFGL